MVFHFQRGLSHNGTPCDIFSANNFYPVEISNTKYHIIEIMNLSIRKKIFDFDISCQTKALHFVSIANTEKLKQKVIIIILEYLHLFDNLTEE